MSSTQIKIKWKEAEDRHCQGITSIGSVWIRLDKKDKVTAMYTMFGSTHKYMPTEPGMTDLRGAKLELERHYGVTIYARKIAKENVKRSIQT